MKESYDFKLNTTQSIIVGRDRESFRENSKRI